MMYGSEVLKGMKTKVGAVNAETDVEAIAHSGASTSIISRDLEKNMDMIIYDKADAIYSWKIG